MLKKFYLLNTTQYETDQDGCILFFSDNSEMQLQHKRDLQIH